MKLEQLKSQCYQSLSKNFNNIDKSLKKEFKFKDNNLNKLYLNSLPTKHDIFKTKKVNNVLYGPLQFISDKMGINANKQSYSELKFTYGPYNNKNLNPEIDIVFFIDYYFTFFKNNNEYTMDNKCDITIALYTGDMSDIDKFQTQVELI